MIGPLIAAAARVGGGALARTAATGTARTAATAGAVESTAIGSGPVANLGTAGAAGGRNAATFRNAALIASHVPMGGQQQVQNNTPVNEEQATGGVVYPF